MNITGPLTSPQTHRGSGRGNCYSVLGRAAREEQRRGHLEIQEVVASRVGTISIR